MRSLSKARGARQQAKRSLHALLLERVLPTAVGMTILAAIYSPAAAQSFNNVTLVSDQTAKSEGLPDEGFVQLEVPMMTISRPSVFQIPDANSVNAVEEPIAKPEVFDGLDARDAACLAARHWLPANQLRQHAKALEDLYCKEKNECLRKTVHAVANAMRLQADHQQDIGAAAAMKAYYALVAAKSQHKLMAEAREVLLSREEQQNKLMQQGIAAAVDLTLFDRERLALTQRELELKHNIARLSHTLNELCRTNRNWEEASLEPLEVRETVVDTVFLQEFAATQRRDLASLNSLTSHISAETAPFFASISGGITGMASLPLPKLCMLDRLLGRQTYPGLVQNLRQELTLATETLSTSIRQTVFDKSTALELSYQQLEIGDQIIASWRKRVQQLSRLAELGDSRPSEIAAAESALLEARAKSLERMLTAKLAEVELAEACGGLHVRCCNGDAWLVASPKN